ncbi:DUF1272 domain-containing protein [Mycobacteroides abscessus]|uniref:DUF1272 domain-containing protein n=2 Tax=Mycobacteroides abscessus TaxID=36809 RepID=UPI002D2199D6|nr:DUF1272 domain-containing protein [Mycobacteroides abscessus]
MRGRYRHRRRHPRRKGSCQLQGGMTMLKMKTKCELCTQKLADDATAWICSYECTYCPDCQSALNACPNCAGELVRRPRRTTGVAEIATRTPSRIARRLRRHRG